ncbi:DNA alkylation repair protein [Salicibibacter cibarius]|uniref:DNA alkylation repair protein n=1 Tax=Salicibibacter cibarius TaxID=2743000 RepID=A0A7T6Z4T9_9BACI|nr:DNA alkylation repair protein [Salicibibacter cibarius]QQK76808.1 DNA alkylation repair protein [Salicibibacter cibarius]
MSKTYVCPRCQTNRSRFHIMEQVPKAVKMDPQSGEVVQEFEQEQLDPFHIPYSGPNYRIQCGACGLNEDERLFMRF